MPTVTMPKARRATARSTSGRAAGPDHRRRDRAADGRAAASHDGTSDVEWTVTGPVHGCRRRTPASRCSAPRPSPATEIDLLGRRAADPGHPGHQPADRRLLAGRHPADRVDAERRRATRRATTRTTPTTATRDHRGRVRPDRGDCRGRSPPATTSRSR